MSDTAKTSDPKCPKCGRTEKVQLLNLDIYSCGNCNVTFKRPE